MKKIKPELTQNILRRLSERAFYLITLKTKCPFLDVCNFCFECIQALKSRMHVYKEKLNNFYS